jgi:hypothetical protein
MSLILLTKEFFFAGWGDTLTFGLTAKIRQGLGYDDVVDKNSSAYQTGTTVGQLHNVALGLVGGSASGVLGLVQKGMQLSGEVAGVIHGVEAIKNGDVLGAVQAFMSVGLTAARGVSACNRVSTVVQWGQRALHGAAAGQMVISAAGKFANGDWFGGFVDLADAGANLYMMGCFAAGTPLLTPTGSKAIEQFQVGDLVLARSEFDPTGPLEAKCVEELFVNFTTILNLHVGGQVIRTSAEHPFYVRHKGWLPAHELQVGDLLSSHDGRWLPVEDVLDTGEYEAVYNMRVEDFHTYFVGTEEWGFCVWAHNTGCASGSSDSSKSKKSPTITGDELKGKTRAEIKDLAKKKGLEAAGDMASPDYPRKWKDPVTGKQRIRLDHGHIDPDTGKPYDNRNAAVDHVHGYEPDGVTKITVNGDPHIPTI